MDWLWHPSFEQATNEWIIKETLGMNFEESEENGKVQIKVCHDAI